MEIKRKQPLGIELVRRGVVNGDAIEKALQYQTEHPNRRLGDILYILKEAEPNELAEEIGDIIGVKGIYLTDGKIKIEPTEYLPLDMMKNYKAIPFDIESGKIKIAFADIANNQDNIKSVKMLVLNKGLVMEPYMAFETNIDEYFTRFEEVSTTVMENLEETESVTDLVDNIIKLAIEKRASDVHIEPQIDAVRIRFRIRWTIICYGKHWKRKTSTNNRKIKSHIKYASRKTRITRW